MPTTLPEPHPPAKQTKPCAACGRPVIRTKTDAGDLLILEYCTPGSSAGTHTITAPLFGGLEPTATKAKGRGFRVHVCPKAEPERAHSAASFEGKRAVSYGIGAYNRARGRR